MGRIQALFFIAAGALVSGCSKEEPPPSVTYGEPIGVRMEASPGVPAFEMALAVTEGADAGALVASVSKAVREAFVACPGAVARGDKGEGTEIAFVIEDGKAVVAAPVDGEAGCVQRAFVDLPIASTQKVGVLVQVRFTKPAAAAASAAP